MSRRDGWGQRIVDFFSGWSWFSGNDRSSVVMAPDNGAELDDVEMGMDARRRVGLVQDPAQVFAGQRWADRVTPSRHDTSVRKANITFTLSHPNEEGEMKSADFFVRMVARLTGLASEAEADNKQVKAILAFYKKLLESKDIESQAELSELVTFINYFEILQGTSSSAQQYLDTRQMKSFIALCEKVGLKVEGCREFNAVSTSAEYEAPVSNAQISYYEVPADEGGLYETPVPFGGGERAVQPGEIVAAADDSELYEMPVPVKDHEEDGAQINHPVIILSDDEEDFSPEDFVFRKATAAELTELGGKVNKDLVRSISGRRIFPKVQEPPVIYDMGTHIADKEDEEFHAVTFVGQEEMYDMATNTNVHDSEEDSDVTYDMATEGGRPLVIARSKAAGSQPVYDFGTVETKETDLDSEASSQSLNDSGQSGHENSSSSSAAEAGKKFGFGVAEDISVSDLCVFVRVPKRAPALYDLQTMMPEDDGEQLDGDGGYVAVGVDAEDFIAVTSTPHPNLPERNIGTTSNPWYVYQADAEGTFYEVPGDGFPEYESLEDIEQKWARSQLSKQQPPALPGQEWALGYRSNMLIAAKMHDPNAAMINEVISLLNGIKLSHKSNKKYVALAVVVVIVVAVLISGVRTNWWGLVNGGDGCVSDEDASADQEICLSALRTLKSELDPGSYYSVTSSVLQAIYNAFTPAEIALLPGVLSTSFDEQSMIAHLRATCPAEVVSKLCSWDNDIYESGLTGLLLPPSASFTPSVTFSCPALSVNQYEQVPASLFLPSEVLHGSTGSIVFKEMNGARVETSAGPVAAVSGEYRVPAADVANYFIKVTGYGTPNFQVAHVIDVESSDTVVETNFSTCQISATAAAPSYSELSQTGSVAASGVQGQQLTFDTSYSTSASGVIISNRILSGLPAGAQVSLSDGSSVLVENHQATLPATGIFHVTIPDAGTHSLSLVPCVNFGGNAPHCYETNPTLLTADVAMTTTPVPPTESSSSSSTAATTTTLRITPTPVASSSASQGSTSAATPTPEGTTPSTPTIAPNPVVTFTCPAMGSVPEDNAVLVTQYTSAISVSNGVVTNYKFTPSAGVSIYQSGSVVVPVDGVVTITAGQEASYSIRASQYGSYNLGVAVDVRRNDDVIVSTDAQTCSLNFSAVAPAYSDIVQQGSLSGSGVDGDFIAFDTGFSVSAPDTLSGRVLKQIPAGSTVRLSDGSNVAISNGQARLPATGSFLVSTPVGDYTMTLSPCVNYGGPSEQCYTEGVSLQAHMAPTTTTTTTTTTPPPAVVSMGACPNISRNEGTRENLSSWTNQASVQNGSLQAFQIQALSGVGLYRNGALQTGTTFTIPVSQVSEWQVGTPSNFDYGIKSMQIRVVAQDLRGQQVVSAFNTCSMTFNPVASPISWSGATSYQAEQGTWITVSGTVNLATGETLLNMALASPISGLQTQSLSVNSNGQFSWQFKSDSQASYSPSLIATVDYDGTGSATPQQHTEAPRVLSLLFNAPCHGARCRREAGDAQEHSFSRIALGSK